MILRTAAFLDGFLSLLLLSSVTVAAASTQAKHDGTIESIVAGDGSLKKMMRREHHGYHSIADSSHRHSTLLSDGDGDDDDDDDDQGGIRTDDGDNRDAFDESLARTTVKTDSRRSQGGPEPNKTTAEAKDISKASADDASATKPAKHISNTTAENKKVKAKQRAASKDHRKGKVKNGFCKNWKEGSSVRALGESSSYWGAQHQLTEESCFDKCDGDKACEQAVFQANTQECWLGLNAMGEDPGPNKCKECVNTCYAKNGFGYKLDIDVQDGWCSNFVESYGGEKPKQCDLTAVTVESQKECSHWGAEYGLSERGCWVKCQENKKCTQAIYENKEGSWSCFIGTASMTSGPGPSRCKDCNNRCYAPKGFPAKSETKPAPAKTKEDTSKAAPAK